MRKILAVSVAVAALAASQFAMADLEAVESIIPQSVMQVSEGLTGAKLTLESKEVIALAPDACSNSYAETYAIAYNTGGSVGTNIYHKGYHEAILINCTGSSRYFTVEIKLNSTDGSFYAKEPVLVSDDTNTIVRFRSEFYQSYNNTGNYTLSASTNASGPASANVTDYGNVGIF